jgi:hypothetical protein
VLGRGSNRRTAPCQTLRTQSDRLGVPELRAHLGAKTERVSSGDGEPHGRTENRTAGALSGAGVPNG